MLDLTLTSLEMQGLNKDEVELAMARKLEIMLLPHLRRDIAFFYAGGNLKGKSMAYNHRHTKEEIERLTFSNETLPIVCKPLCEVVSEILRENGIDAFTITCDTDMFKHTDVLITTKTGKKYILNYLEDMELVQTRMATPDFASEKYYIRRYQKFENTLTPDGKSVEGVAFLSRDRLSMIDENIGYKHDNMYRDDVIEQIKREFDDFRNIMARNEIINAGRNISPEEKRHIIAKYQCMSDDEVIEAKLDWIFSFFNGRENINGHTDFVMYYKTLLKRLFSEEDISKMERYDCFVPRDKFPNDSVLINILDLERNEETAKKRFAVVRFIDKYYIFSTKANAYVKLGEEDFKEINSYSIIIRSERPSELVLKLCDLGHALPLVFNPIGLNLLNQREQLIAENDSKTRSILLDELVNSIEAYDDPITMLVIPYPDGTQKRIFVDDNNEIAIDDGENVVTYHYEVDTESFSTEVKRKIKDGSVN